MNTQTLPELTNDLLADLLDSTIGPFDICLKHDLSIFQVRAIVRTEEFRAIRDAVVEIAEARFSLQLPRARQTALDQLARIAAIPAQTPAHAETIRKAVGTILRWKTTAPASPPPADAPADPASSPPPPRRTPGSDSTASGPADQAPSPRAADPSSLPPPVCPG